MYPHTAKSQIGGKTARGIKRKRAICRGCFLLCTFVILLPPSIIYSRNLCSLLNLNPSQSQSQSRCLSVSVRVRFRACRYLSIGMRFVRSRPHLIRSVVSLLSRSSQFHLIASLISSHLISFFRAHSLCLLTRTTTVISTLARSLCLPFALRYDFPSVQSDNSNNKQNFNPHSF